MEYAREIVPTWISLQKAALNSKEKYFNWYHFNLEFNGLGEPLKSMLRTSG